MRRRTLVVQLVAMAIAMVVGCVLLLSKLDASAAPLPSPPAGLAASGASSQLEAPADAGADTDAQPIDLAVAPDGGVPFHPSGTTFRSPFAKPNAGPAVRVKVAMLLNSVDEYDVKTGLFSADFFVSFTSTAPMPTLALQYPNGDVSGSEVLADKPTFKLYRVKGKFKSPPDLRKYPFDAQKLAIYVEDDAHGIDQVRFTADRERAQLARGFRALGWSVTYIEARAFSHSYPDRFEGDDLYYGRYIFELGVQRYSTSAAFKVYVPADQLMLGVYICLMLGMISTWFMFVVKEQHIERVFRIARVAVPVASVAVMSLACML
jgi:hypothetical protein